MCINCNCLGDVEFLDGPYQNLADALVEALGRRYNCNFQPAESADQTIRQILIGSIQKLSRTQSIYF